MCPRDYPRHTRRDHMCVYSCFGDLNSVNQSLTFLGREMAAVEHCFRLLRRQQRENTPEMEAIRCLTLKLYEGSVQKLAQGSSESARIRGAQTWMGLGSYIPREGPRIMNRWTPPLLKRCGWQECLCSVYKPAHRMRVCNGCCKVAYCGDRCQKQCVLFLSNVVFVLKAKCAETGIVVGTRNDVRVGSNNLCLTEFGRIDGEGG